jgi:hypothetical protein
MTAPSIAAQIKALQKMSLAELQARWLEVFGKEATQRNRSYLWRRLAWRLQEDFYGTLPAEDRAKIEEYRRQFESTPPETWFPRGCGAKQKTATRPLRDPRLPSPGTILTRRYKGRQLNVKVGEKDFEFRGRKYRSLSAIATEVTGSRWNGFLFFGLTKGAGHE